MKILRNKFKKQSCMPYKEVCSLSLIILYINHYESIEFDKTNT